MTHMTHGEALWEVGPLLAKVLGTPVESRVLHGPRDHSGDVELHLGDLVLLAEVKMTASADRVGYAIRQLRRRGPAHPCAIPLLVVPYMGEVARHLCREEGLSWLDLSGNADIAAPGLRVHVEGKPNAFKRAGRPANLFAPRSSRVARALLLSPDRAFSQAELAQETRLLPSQVSRLVRRYEEAGFVRREGPRRRSSLRLADRDLLLDSWRQSYAFSVHNVREGHVAAPTGVDLLGRLARDLGQRGIGYAATGLAGAWLLEPVAVFRLVTLYVRAWPPPGLLADLGYRDEPRGSNVWLVRPRDDGVFDGGGVRDGVAHVSAVQAYLDLRSQPERADEAAEALRTRLLAGSRHGA